jgi:hypothetical protein
VAALRNVTRSDNFFGGCSRDTYQNAWFDEIKIHNRSLTHQEILNDMNYNRSYIVPFQ